MTEPLFEPGTTDPVPTATGRWFFRRVIFASSAGTVLASLAAILRWPQYDTLSWFGLGWGVSALIFVAVRLSREAGR